MNSNTPQNDDNRDLTNPMTPSPLTSATTVSLARIIQWREESWQQSK